jgi:hypothetical protein
VRAGESGKPQLAHLITKPPIATFISDPISGIFYNVSGPLR